jgi:hypothetical protein
VGYDWRPNAVRSATTDPNIVVAPPCGAAGADASAGPDLTVAAAAEWFLAAAETGRALNRSGRPYRPSALRDVRGILDYHVVPELGEVRLRSVRRRHIQALVDRLGDEGLSESRIRSVVSALRALFGYAIEHGRAEYNPADALVMPGADEDAGTAAEPRRWVDEAVRAASSHAATVRDRAGELWDDRPRWEPRPPRTPVPAPPEDDGREAGRETSRRDYEPIVQVPERLLSLALRAVVVLFVLLLLVTLVESA